VTEVRVFKNQTGLSADPIANTPYRQFNAFATSFIGGAVVAVADLGSPSGSLLVSNADGSSLDGKSEILVGSGAGMRATVKIFEATSTAPKLVRQVLPFAATYTGGVSSISVGRADSGDMISDLVIGAASGGNSAVEVRNGRTAALITSFVAYTDASRQAPVRTTVRDANKDGVLDEIWTAQGTDGKTRQIKRFQLNGTAVDSVLEQDANFRGEYFIA
jgi:hypothetical protein